MRSVTQEDLCRHPNGLRVLIIVSCTLWFQFGYAEGIGEALNDPGEVGLTTDRLDRIDGLLQRYVDDGRLPGAVYAVVRHGRLARIAHGGSVQPDTLFRIYSMTKPVTVVGVLMLYEEGKFLLTDPVALYLPEFTDMQVYVGEDNEEGRVETRPAERPITIEDLLTHTAGLSYDDDTVAGVPKLYAQADFLSVDSLS